MVKIEPAIEPALGEKQRLPAVFRLARKLSGMLFPRSPERLLLLLLGSFVVASLFLVKDYGMNIDSQKNFREGEMHLNFLLHGRVDEVVLSHQMHGAFIFMLADAAKRLLSDRLPAYDAVSARHVILPVLAACFLATLFLFVRRHWSSRHGLVAVGILLTFPAFWGNTFNNLKDIPLLIFFSLTIMSFVEWHITGELLYLYESFVLLGLALSIKLYAFLAVAVLLLWFVVRPSRSRGPAPSAVQENATPHVVAGILIAFAVVLTLYAPAFWGSDNKLSCLAAWRAQLGQLTYGKHKAFNVMSVVQVLNRTPVPLLVFSVLGIFAALKNVRRSPLNSLLLIWGALPVLIHCLPNSELYDGMRHFLVFLVPFSLLATVGLWWAAALLARVFNTHEGAIVNGLASLVIGVNLWGIVATHPYETTYFNALAGGLKGAQTKNIPFAWDYWLNSYKQAGRWLSGHGAPDASVLAVYYSFTQPEFNTELIRESVQRPDLKVTRLPEIPMEQARIAVPENTYLILVPFDYLRPRRQVLERSGEFQEVFRIERQGGEICTIYYKPKTPLRPG